MKRALPLALLGASAIAFSPACSTRAPTRATARESSTLDTPTTPEQDALDRNARRDLEDFAIECNPKIEYFDPLQLADQKFWDRSNAETIAFLRHAEMKHGRIAMLSFIGYVVQANELHFPWATEANGFPPFVLSPADQWDVLDPLAKFQLFFFIGCLEIWSEAAPSFPHYMRQGGQPGKFPPFVDASGKRLSWFLFDLWDPLGTNMEVISKEKKAVKLAKEVNNGRLAMLGLFSFFVESKVPGAVPLLTLGGFVKPYEGQYMLPFNYWDLINFFFDEGRWEHASLSSPAVSGLDFTPW